VTSRNDGLASSVKACKCFSGGIPSVLVSIPSSDSRVPAPPIASETLAPLVPSDNLPLWCQHPNTRWAFRRLIQNRVRRER
jgi:hypothetical protein